MWLTSLASLIQKHLMATLAVVTLTGTTLATSTAGIAKLYQSYKSQPNNVPMVKTLQEVQDQQAEIAENENKNNSAGGFGNLVQTSAQTTGNTQQLASSNTTSTNTPASTTTDTRCIITLWGKQYDITSLRSSHPGGDIFTCGTDMTSVYSAQHGTNLSRMQPYLITGTSTPTPRPTSVATPTPLPTSNNNQANQQSNPNACIITLWGKQYDVSPLQSGHPGGNIFTCGTDMTSVYSAQHGTNLSRMQPYLVQNNTGSTTPSSTINPTPRNTSGDDHREEDHDDEEREWERVEMENED